MSRHVNYGNQERQDSCEKCMEPIPSNPRSRRSNSVWDILTPETWKDFMAVYHDLVKDLTSIEGMDDMPETHEWLSRVLDYNVPFGKRLRGLSTALAYKHMSGDLYTVENSRLAKILGWCVEIFQASILMTDDIMDHSEMRRGKPCWYKVDGMGVAAMNDAFLLESSCFMILKKYFRAEHCYADLVDLFHDILHKTYYGQSLDTRVVFERNFETYTMEKFLAISKYKTGYETFYMPIILAMTLLEMEDQELKDIVQNIAIDIGHYYQVQNDYMDCFGSVASSGKEGTDIQEGKCTWLFVKAMEKSTADQKTYLLANYGYDDPKKVDGIKELYRNLELVEEYEAHEEKVLNILGKTIEDMPEVLPKSLFQDLVTKIFLNGVSTDK